MNERFATIVAAAPAIPRRRGLDRSMWGVRLIALVGVVIAVMAIRSAFGVHTALGLSVAYASPVIPLGLVLGLDRARNRPV